MTWAHDNWDSLESAGHYPRKSNDGDLLNYHFRKRKVGSMKADRCFVLAAPDDFYAIPYGLVRPLLSDDESRHPNPYWSIGVDGSGVLIVDGESTGVDVSQYRGNESIPLDV